MKKLLFTSLILISVLPCNLMAQKQNDKKVTYSGKVVDYKGQPIKRAILFVDSSETLTKTNGKGIYKFKTKAVVKNLAVFSSEKGMISKNVSGLNKVDFIFPKDMPVVLRSDLADMGYNLQLDKSDRYRKYDNIFDLIATEFTGVTVRNGKIKVRGSATYSGGAAEPLYVVDGTYVRSLSTVIPTEIKSIEILKDQDATLYGARGAHGVIIVELKKYRD